MTFRSSRLGFGIAGIVLVSATAACAAAPQTSAHGGSATAGIWGTAWRLEDLGGAGVLDRVEATLEFPEVGKAVGSGSCNQFFATVEISGESMTFGPLAATRMVCAGAVGTQERKYLGALRGAKRFALEGSVLLIYANGKERPLRFRRARP